MIDKFVICGGCPPHEHAESSLYVLALTPTYLQHLLDLSAAVRLLGVYCIEEFSYSFSVLDYGVMPETWMQDYGWENEWIAVSGTLPAWCAAEPRRVNVPTVVVTADSLLMSFADHAGTNFSTPIDLADMRLKGE